MKVYVTCGIDKHQMAIFRMPLTLTVYNCQLELDIAEGAG